MIHGKKKSLKGILYLKKAHLCPRCNTRMRPISVKKVVNSRSKEAKKYNFHLSYGHYMKGNIEFTWKELKCPSCGYQLNIERMQRFEEKNEDYKASVKRDKRERFKILIFKIACFIFVVLWIVYALYKIITFFCE